MDRTEIAHLARALSRSGFGAEDRIVFLLSIVQSYSEGNLVGDRPLRTFFQMADDLELALSNKEILLVLQGISFLQIEGKTVRVAAIETEREELRRALAPLFSTTDREPQAASGIEVDDLLKSATLSAGWATKIVGWCEAHDIDATPVFWSFDSEEVSPLARSIGSFASCEVALLVVQGERYGIRSQERSARTVLKFFARFLNRYTDMHPKLQGAIAFDQLDDDYPGSDTVQFEGLQLTCPTVNSSAQALLVCCLARELPATYPATRLVRFVLDNQNDDGSWPIHRFEDARSSPAQVMSSSLALEALSALARTPDCLGDAWHEVKNEIRSAIGGGAQFILNKLEMHSLIDAAFGVEGDVRNRLGITALALQAMLDAAKVGGLDGRNLEAFWSSFERWRRQVEEEWRPDWKSVIRVRIPVPQWGGTFDPNQFAWELPRDAIVANVLIDAEVFHENRMSRELRRYISQTVNETLAVQKDGIWRDIPMALEKNDRGFPQNTQIYTRFLYAYLMSLRKQLLEQIDSKNSIEFKADIGASAVR